LPEQYESALALSGARPSQISYYQLGSATADSGVSEVRRARWYKNNKEILPGSKKRRL